MITRKLLTSDIAQLEILFQLIQRTTFVDRPKNNFQIGDFKKSTMEDEVWIAVENNIILGFVSIYVAENFIHNLFIHPYYQKRGIGKKLLQIAEANLKTPMTLKVAMDNLNVGHFYTKYGWRFVSVHKNVKQPYVIYSKN